MKRSPVLFSIALLALPLTAASPTNPGDHKDPEGFKVVAVSVPEGSFEVDQNLKADLELIAEEQGITYAQAVKSFSWENDFAAVVEEARVRFPNSYISAEITGDDENPAWMAFKDVPEEWVDASLSKLPVAVEIRRFDGLTEVEQNELVQEVHYAVQGLPLVEEAASSIDPITGEISVDYSLNTYASLSRHGSVLDEVSGALPASVLERVSLTRVEGALGGTEADLYGGGQLKKNGSNYCTAGFTVTKSGVKGILTAGHCLTPMTYGSTTLTNKASTTGSQGDLRWLSTTQTIHNRVYTSSSTTVAITATGGPVVGQTLSFYGRKTGASTDKVYKLNECSGNYCNMTMMHRHKTDRGDSGGPWRSGSTAYGVHHGYKTVTLIERSLFTRVGLANVNLGVAIKVTP